MAAAIAGTGTTTVGSTLTFTGTGFTGAHLYTVKVQLPAPYGATADSIVTSTGGGGFSVTQVASIPGQYIASVYDGTTLVTSSAAVVVGGVQPSTVTGSRGGNAALASLLTTLAAIGYIVDGTTA